MAEPTPALDTLSQKIREMSPEEIQNFANQLSIEEITKAIAVLTPGFDQNWREKLQAFFYALNSRSSIESMGRSITAKQALAAIDGFKVHDDAKHYWKLSPLLVGISQNTFLYLLAISSEEQLKVLQHEALAEGIQHHLTLLAHHIEHIKNLTVTAIEEITQEINTFPLKEINTPNFLPIYAKIDELKDNTERYGIIINKALALAWNTNRPDLIDSFTNLKENLQRIDEREIGSEKSQQSSSTGLYYLLGKRLSSIYGDPDNPSNFDTIIDEDPEIEAMAKLSLWYLKDYWEIGLLPSISNEKHLRLDPSKYSDTQSQEHREKLLNEVRNNLHSIGLTTVKDFKNHKIFSKESLKRYISKHLF
ncbi:MAG: hypothetical protein Tsb0021_12030 [Chlamydiales bacterium]